MTTKYVIKLTDSYGNFYVSGDALCFNSYSLEHAKLFTLSEVKKILKNADRDCEVYEVTESIFKEVAVKISDDKVDLRG